MKKIGMLILLGLMVVVCSFFGARGETEVPVLCVGDQWSFGWYNGEFTNATGKVVGHMMNVTVDRVEDFQGVPCYVCVYSYPIDPNDLINRTYTVWMTADWVVLKTEDYLVYYWAETRITFVWSPGMKLFDFPLIVGKGWSDRSYRTIEQTWWEAGNEETETAADYMDWSRKVVSTETVNVPAGTFETYVLEGFGGELPMSLEQRSYFSLDVKNHVKAEFPGEGGGGKVLTSYELALQGEEGNVFSDWLVPIALTVSFGILGFTYFFISRRQRNHGILIESYQMIEIMSIKGGENHKFEIW